jgi:hypothetical protein
MPIAALTSPSGEPGRPLLTDSYARLVIDQVEVALQEWLWPGTR